MFQEIKINNALEKEIQPDGSSVITIDAYDGCQIQCPYCFQLNNKEWSRKIYIRTNIADVLKEQLHIGMLDNGAVISKTELFIGSLSDPYMDIEKKYELTKSVLEVLKDMDYKVYVTTKAVNGLIIRDLKLLKSFKTAPEILLGLSHIEQAGMGTAHSNIRIANKLCEEGILVKVFITPVLPYIMDIDAMITALNPQIPIYLDKLRIFDKGNQAEKIYECVKARYPMYADRYFKLLFEEDEDYYFDLVKKYQSNKRIIFMSELWNE